MNRNEWKSLKMTRNSLFISNVNKEMKRNPRCYVKKWTRAHGTEQRPKEWTLILFVVCVLSLYSYIVTFHWMGRVNFAQRTDSFAKKENCFCGKLVWKKGKKKNWKFFEKKSFPPKKSFPRRSERGKAEKSIPLKCKKLRCTCTHFSGGWMEIYVHFGSVFLKFV